MGIFSNFRASIKRYRTFDPEQAYLAAAVSESDVERRQRDIDNGRFRRRQWPY